MGNQPGPVASLPRGDISGEDAHWGRAWILALQEVSGSQALPLHGWGRPRPG